MRGTLLLHLSTSLAYFGPRTFCLDNGLANLPCDASISDSNTKPIITIKNVPGSAIDRPCGVWGHRWRIWPLYGGPVLRLFFKNDHLWVWNNGEEFYFNFLHLYMFCTLPYTCFFPYKWLFLTLLKKTLANTWYLIQAVREWGWIIFLHIWIHIFWMRWFTMTSLVYPSICGPGNRAQ